jgi:D-beta-D-heptose 7-phosphate kinase/D-beta-D-heptose 1-phosphate adenosyltransferase
MLKDKIRNLNSLKKTIISLRNKGKKIVFTNGCFDILHYGHVRYLEDAKRKGDILIVAVNSDTSVRRIKGNKRPIVNEEDRLSLVAALESVDYVTIFEEDTPLKVIKALRPDVLIKGADWNRKSIVGSGLVSTYGGKVLTVRMVKNRSTTNLIKKIAKLF